mgnify:CR=1 FL=1
MLAATLQFSFCAICSQRMYIKDGHHYDEVARCCMGYAHDKMKTDFDLVEYSSNPSSAFHDPMGLCSSVLHSKDLHTFDKVLVIIPGKGKVRAGIFGRQLLMCHSLQTGSAFLFAGELFESIDYRRA